MPPSPFCPKGHPVQTQRSPGQLWPDRDSCFSFREIDPGWGRFFSKTKGLVPKIDPGWARFPFLLPIPFCLTPAKKLGDWQFGDGRRNPETHPGDHFCEAPSRQLAAKRALPRSGLVGRGIVRQWFGSPCGGSLKLIDRKSTRLN